MNAHSLRRRPAALLLGGALAAAALTTACGQRPSKAAAAPLRYKGASLPTTAGKVHLGGPPYHGPGKPLYTAASRYFRWPLLVPAQSAGLKGPLSAQVSRFFGGTFDITSHGRAVLVPGSYVAGNPVAPAAYQVRIDYRLHGEDVTLFEGVHAYVPPKGARALRLPGHLSGGVTWTAAPAPGAPSIRYVEGESGGLHLMAYGPAKRLPASALASLFSHLERVALPKGPAPKVKP